MPRYFTHLYNSIGHLPDEEGVWLADLDEARQVAIINIRSLLSEELKGGSVNLNGRIEVADESGKRLLVVPFAEAVRVIADDTRS